MADDNQKPAETATPQDRAEVAPERPDVLVLTTKANPADPRDKADTAPVGDVLDWLEAAERAGRLR